MGKINLSEKIKHIGNELASLKDSHVIKETDKRVISLKGMLKGIVVSEKDIKKAKKSLFKISS